MPLHSQLTLPPAGSDPANAVVTGRSRRYHVPDFEGCLSLKSVVAGHVDAALRFYRDILGLAELFRPGPNLAFLGAGGVRLRLTTPQGAGAVGQNSILYFKVEKIAEAYAAIVGRGAAEERVPVLTVKMPDHELWIGFVRDPEGNLVGLMEEKR